MKILITGQTTLDCVEGHYLNQQLRVIPGVVALVSGLRELGHEVEQRIVKWGDDLDQYDRIITFLGPTDTFCAGYTDGALWTLTREDTLCAISDWQTDRVFLDPLKKEAKWKEVFAGQLNGATDREKIDELHDQWLCGRRILLTAFEGGDLDLVFSKASKKMAATERICEGYSLFGYDPNPLLPLRRPKTTFDAKIRQWIVAGLSEANRKSWKKLKPTLPVVEVGKRGQGGIRMPEDEIVDYFAKSWYHWLPGYSHAGSGWWRARFQQLSDGLVISVCADPKEAEIFGPSWVIADPLSLEEMSDKELHELAVQQRKEFVERHPTDDFGKSRSLVRLEEFVS
jgi:hypothetical protein